MRKIFAAIITVFFVAMLASCARVKTNITVYNPSGVQLKTATYTYLYLDNQHNPNYQYITQLVDRKLQSYGMVKASNNAQYNVVIIYQLAANSASHTDSLQVAIFNAKDMYNLQSKPVYLVNVISNGKPKDQNGPDVLEHLVDDAFKTFPAADGKSASYPENY